MSNSIRVLLQQWPAPTGGEERSQPVYEGHVLPSPQASARFELPILTRTMPIGPGHDDDVYAAVGYAINHSKDDRRRCVAVLLLQLSPSRMIVVEVLRHMKALWCPPDHPGPGREMRGAEDY
jgi:hypothetical protein